MPNDQAKIQLYSTEKNYKVQFSKISNLQHLKKCNEAVILIQKPACTRWSCCHDFPEISTFVQYFTFYMSEIKQFSPKMQLDGHP